MQIMSRGECIDRIQEMEENAGYGQDEMMPKLTKRKTLERMSDQQLVDELESLTTNYGEYKIE
jgi:hypothetical protein